MALPQDSLINKLRDIRRSDEITVDRLMILLPSTNKTLTPGGDPAIREAIVSWQKMERNDSLTKEDLFKLESIILPALRPAFDIVGDSFGELPTPWTDIYQKRSAIEPLIKGIGRINLAGHPKFSRVGTGFVCGENLLLTNRHVAEIFSTKESDGKLLFTPGIRPSVDLKEEVGSTTSIPISITQPVTILDDWDIAVLSVDSLPAEVNPLPLMSSAPKNIEERLATIIGYPSMDPEEDLVQQLQIFRSVFDKKRLQPGRLKGLKQVYSFGKRVDALTHDCSTLAGNSGSAVIDIDSTKIVGVHFSGERPVTNYAVPSWKLYKHPLLKDLKIEFAG